jgi:hypothetical protein
MAACAEAALHRLMPHGVFRGDVALLATMEGQRLRRLVSAVRYSLRNGCNARSPEVAALKAMCRKSPDKDCLPRVMDRMPTCA